MNTAAKSTSSRKPRQPAVVTTDSESKHREIEREKEVASLRDLFLRMQTAHQPPDIESPRGRILDTALTLFAEKGFHGVGVREIAIAANVNQAMVHYYFNTKEQLYHRVIATQMVNVAQFALSQLDLSIPPSELILSFPRRITRMLVENPKWSRLILREVAEGGKHLAATVIELGELGPQGLSVHLGRLYKKGSQFGDLIDLQPSMAIPLLIGFSYSATFIEPFFRIISQTEGESEKFNELRIELMEHLWRCGMTTPLPRGKKHASK